ncbi:hypothetical protein ACKWTF_014097 [Chironomus riparius]
MSRYLILLFLSIQLLMSLTSAAELSCEYKTNTDWWAINNVYFCDQDTDLFVTKFNSNLTGVNGRHSNGKSNSDVIGYRVYEKRLHYFPAKLSNFFPNLEFIAIWDAELMEIRQRDLAPFTDLRILSIWKNKLETLEKNLFKFKTKLEYIGLGQNRIKFVDGRIFNHLKNLYSLHFDGNVCASRQVGDDKHEVWDLVEEIEDQCTNLW